MNARWLQVVLIVVIALGAIVRFTHLDTKVYSHDETLTSLRTSGYLEAEYRHAVAGQTLTVAQLQTFQHANAQRDARSTIRALAVDDPQHPPLYYLLERFWDMLFGGSIAARRSLGAVFGLLTIPALYWLCRELATRAYAFPLIATVLFAVSPFELEYTQQAREYTLWGLLCVLSSALFVRACRTNSSRAWVGYALIIALGMYAHTFFAFVIAAHVVWAIYLTLCKQGPDWRALLLSIFAAGCAYTPWAYNLLSNRQTVQATNTWFAAAVPLPVYLYKFLFNVSAVFFDAEYTNFFYSILLLPICALAGWSLLRMLGKNERPAGVFVLALFVTAVFPLLVQDLLHHESRATAARYLLPAFIAINLSVAYSIAIWLTQGGTRAILARATLGALLLLAGLSWGVSANATSWYTASSDAPVLTIASQILAKPNALVLTDNSVLGLQLSNYLRPADRFVFSGSAPAQFLQAKAANRFILEPTAAACAALARDPDVSLSLAYEPTFTDSPMLHLTFMNAPLVRSVFASLRKKMTAIHGDATGIFRILHVSASNADRSTVPCS